jgi:hypothetical protein
MLGRRLIEPPIKEGENMSIVTRERCITIIQRTLYSFQNKLNEVHPYKKDLHPAGQEILRKYFEDKSMPIIMTEVIKDKNFFQNLNNEGLLKFISICQNLDKAFELNCGKYEKVTGIIDDYELYKKDIDNFFNGSIKVQLKNIFDNSDIQAICTTLESPMSEKEKIPVINNIISRNSSKLEESSIPDFLINGKRVPVEMKPGNEPWWARMFVGTEIHKKIAEKYQQKHKLENVYTNYYSIKTLIKAKGATTENLSEKEKNMKPDITNLKLMHLYEIKPIGSEIKAKQEVKLYQDTMNKALAPYKTFIALGPIYDDGVKGQIFTDKGKVVNYASPMDGVIIYQIQKNTEKQPLHIVVPEMEFGKEKDYFNMDYWSRVTGLQGYALALFIIFLLALPPFGIPG